MENKSVNNLNDFLKENYNNNKLKLKKKKKIIIILINLITISCLIVAGIGIKSIFDYKKEYQENQDIQKRLANYTPIVKDDTKDNKEKTQEEIEKEVDNLYNFTELKKTNNDTVGWLKVKNTGVDLPIVQTTDNKYYLSHNFEKKYNSLGWAFADYRNDFENLSKNTILYGHTYKDTIIFSTLKNVLKNDWQANEENYIIDFTTPKKQMKWQIFSIYTLKETNDYLKTDFTDQEFYNYLDMIKSRSIKDFNVDISFNDKLLTLSTCYIDAHHRLVVHAKLINDK